MKLIPADTITKVMQVMSLMQTQGLTLTKACHIAGIGYQTYQNAVKADASLIAMHDEAVGMAEDILADKLVNIQEEVECPRMAAVVSKNIQWLLARRRAAKYGDRITVEHQSSRDKLIIERLQRAKARGAPRTLDAQPIEDAQIVVEESEAELLAVLGLGSG